MAGSFEQLMLNKLFDENLLRSKEWREQRKVYQQQVRKFRRKFTASFIEQMSIDQYVPGPDFPDSFGTQIINEVSGSINSMGRNTMFGFRYNNPGKITKKFGNEPTNALKLIKSQILQLVKLDRRINESEYEKNLLAPTLKNKILQIYHQEDYLSVYSPNHQKILCYEFSLPVFKDKPYDTQEALLAFKNEHPVFSQLTLWEFGSLIYKVGITDNKTFRFDKKVGMYKPIPDSRGFKVTDLKQIGAPYNPGSKKRSGKVDHLGTQVSNMKTGELGEEIIMAHLEKEWGSQDDNFRIKQVSKEDDSAGYDIYVFFQEQECFIEVKSSTGAMKNASVYLTRNEYETAKKKKGQYFMFFVEHVNNKELRSIHHIQNPYANSNYEVDLEPVKYRISFMKKLI